MKVFYAWIVIFVVVGVALGFYLIPKRQDYALIQMKGRKIKEAESFYRDEYGKGVRTRDVVIPLSQMNEAKGNLKEAADLLQEYLQSHPHDVLGMRKLSDLFLLNQQPQKYYQTLLLIKAEEEKNAKPADKVLLQELSTWYQNENQSDSLLATLKELVDSGQGEEGDYQQLAYLYASKGLYQEAFNLMDFRRQRFPKKVKIDDILFEVWLENELSKAQGGNAKLQEDSVNLAAEYLLAQKNKTMTRNAISVFHANYPKLVFALAVKLEPLVRNDPALEALVLEMMWEDPEQKKKVYPKLQELDKEIPEHPELENVAFKVYLDMLKDEKLVELIQEAPAEKIEKRSIFNLSTAARSRNKPILAKEMQRALRQPFLDKNPVIDVSLSVGGQDPNARAKLDHLLKTGNLSQTDSYLLFKVAVAAQFDEEALDLGMRLPPFIGLEDYDLIEIALAYAQMHREKEFRQMIESAIPKIGARKAGAALAVLDIVGGNTKNAKDWIDSQKKISRGILGVLFSAAEESKEYPMALFIAKRALADYPSDESRANDALALVQTGEINYGLSLLQDLYKANSDDRSIELTYFSALVFAAKKDYRFQHQLMAFMDKLEKKGNLSQDLLRQFAYAYLDVIHDFKKAEDTFLILAEKAPASSPDVQSLLYLWGPQPSEENVAWIEKRADESSESDLVFWLEDLNGIGRYDKVIQLFDKQPSPNVSPKMYFTYLEALAYQKKKKKMREVIDQAFGYLTERKQLDVLSTYSEEAEYLEGRRMIWEYAVKQWPTDTLAWQNLGKVAFDERDYCRAFHALENFFALNLEEEKPNLKLYDSVYQYGWILEKWYQYDAADTYFRFAWYLIDGARDLTFHMIEVKAVVLYKLGFQKQAQDLMQELYVMASRDPDVGGTFANMLMDTGRLDSTRMLLRGCAFVKGDPEENSQDD